jgi:starch synthase
VFPSLFEGFGRVILEAMAIGLPVITTTHACDDRRVSDGHNGFRVASGDSVTLSEKMRELASDARLRTEMGTRGLELVKDYTWSAYGERCATACRELLGMAAC